MGAAATQLAGSEVDYAEANRIFLDHHLRRVRLQLTLRVRWLQSKWPDFAEVGIEAAELRDRQVERTLKGENHDSFQHFLRADSGARQIAAEMEDLKDEMNSLRSDLGRTPSRPRAGSRSHEKASSKTSPSNEDSPRRSLSLSRPAVHPRLPTACLASSCLGQTLRTRWARLTASSPTPLCSDISLSSQLEIGVRGRDFG